MSDAREAVSKAEGFAEAWRTGGCVRSRSASRQQEELLVPATRPDYIESR